MYEPLISIIIPIYNVEKYLVRCLESVLSQTYTCLEVLLIDDGSTDSSGRIADEYASKDKRFKVFHIQNRGVSEARNYGLSMFQGEYLAFIDADDFVSAVYIERLYEAISICDVRHVVCLPYDSKDGVVETEIQRKVPRKINIKEEFDYSSSYAYGAVWGGLYHRSLVENKSFDRNFYVGEDEIFFSQILSSNDEIAILEERLYIYMIYEQSASRGMYNEKKKTNIQAWEQVQRQFVDYPICFQRKLRARCCATYLQTLKLMKKSGYQEKAWFKYVLKKARETLKDFLCSSYTFSTKISAVLYCFMPNIYGSIHVLMRK